MNESDKYPRRRLAALRDSVPMMATQRTIALVLLICQGAITVTGAIVRVTGSGLGCDTWPNCQAGSLVPKAGAAPAIHQAIEFGNRMLTFVLVAVTVAAIFAIHRAHRRSELKTYVWLSMAGVILQAVIGGISVHLDLRWWAVALHFLPSMMLVWIAALLFARVSEPDDGVRTRAFPAYIRQIATVAACALAVVLTTGTMVTGSGPHSGDADAGMSGRLEVNTHHMAIAHAMCMYVYLILTVVVVWQLYAHRAPDRTKKAAWVLIGAILIQWTIGVMQYHLGVPSWSVPFHIGMSSVVTAFTALLYTHGMVRMGGSADSLTGSPQGDALAEAKSGKENAPAG